jgi:hypothetical protein
MKRSRAIAIVFLIGLGSPPAVRGVDCPVCEGSGERECVVCGGEKKVDEPCKKCGGDGMEPCPSASCRRKPVKSCEFCYGRGERTCRAKNCKAGKVKVECGRCKGTGILPCRQCEGTGKLEEEKEVPTSKGPSPSEVRDVEERLADAKRAIEAFRARLEEVQETDREIAGERKALEASVEEVEGFAKLYPDLRKSAEKIGKDWRAATEDATRRAAAALEEARAKEKDAGEKEQKIEEIGAKLNGISTEGLQEAKRGADEMDAFTSVLPEKLKEVGRRQDALRNVLDGIAPRIREVRASGEKMAAELREIEEKKRRIAASYDAFDASFRGIPLPEGLPKVKTALLSSTRSPEVLNVEISYVDDRVDDAYDLKESPPEPTADYARHIPFLLKAAFSALPSPALVQVSVEVSHRDPLGNRAPVAFQTFKIDGATWEKIRWDLREEWDKILPLCRPTPPYPRERPPLSHLALMIFLAAGVTAVGAGFLAVLRFVRR